ncbi:hypothetical protein P389DRAFT_191765 [Cystobasidium minutum MCA 4210]|uniref:uncharacterized protein n=1 Tax=Cystobasidium minutum MCA 4210 TaxID=1397322 RepID=UPI0034CED8A8|eukprot:jgi/Rhomi1/191765/estExt_fgenesh1_pg.C_120037
MWEFNARLYFEEYMVWDLLNPAEEVARPLSDENKKRLRLIMNKLNSLVGDGPRIHLITCSDARDAFAALRKQYRPKNDVATLAKTNRFLMMRQGENESVTEFMQRIAIEVSELKALGQDVNDFDKVNTLLNGVSPQWQDRAESIRQANEYMGTPIGWDNVQSAFTAAAIRAGASIKTEETPVESSAYRFQNGNQDRSKNQRNNNNQSSNNKKNEIKDLSRIKCFACQEMGHYSNKCPKKPKKNSKKDDESDDDGGNSAIYVAAATGNNDRQLFVGDLKPVSNVYVRLAKSDAIICAKGIGKVSFKSAQADGKVNQADIQEAYWFPEADCNLLSQGRDSRGTAGLTAKYHKVSKMWKVHVVQEDPRMNLAVGGVENWNLWHQRLGHRAMSALKATESLTTGHRDPFPSTGNKAEKPLEKIHADLFGPIVDISVVGNRFGLTEFGGFKKSAIWLQTHSHFIPSYLKEALLHLLASLANVAVGKQLGSALLSGWDISTCRSNTEFLHFRRSVSKHRIELFLKLCRLLGAFVRMFHKVLSKEYVAFCSPPLQPAGTKLSFCSMSRASLCTKQIAFVDVQLRMLRAGTGLNFPP